MFTLRRVRQLEPGVNLFGYVFAEHGVGQEARMLVDIARQAEIPFAVLPYTQTFSRQAVRFSDFGTGEALYDTNLICVNADTVPQFVSHVGRKLLEGRYNIGMWNWEVEKLPDWMARSAQYLDEVWACSQFAAESAARALDCPVVAFPPPVLMPPASSVRRDDLGLPPAFTFLFCFDFNSIFERKNPLAIIDAFSRSFAPGEGAQLVIKTINGEDFQQPFGRLSAAAAEHPNIHVVDGYLSSEQQGALMDLCDAYVSLHRSEGFGFTMAEAMARGKPVIATGYSGNMDFMTEENSYPVPYRLVPVPAGCDPYPVTTRWADPDVAAAAERMRRVFDRRSEAIARGEIARGDIERHHTAEARAALLVDRLEESRQRRIAPRRRPKALTVARWSAPADGARNAPDADRTYRGFESVAALFASHHAVFARSTALEGLSCGSLDGAMLDDNGDATVWGWAFDATRRRPAEAVVLVVNERALPWRVVPRSPRPDVAESLDFPAMTPPGWAFRVHGMHLEAGENRFEAYALLADGRFGRIAQTANVFL